MSASYWEHRQSGLGTRCWSQSGDLGTPGLSAEMSGEFSVPVTRVNYGMETVCAAKKAARCTDISEVSQRGAAGVDCLCSPQTCCR